MNRGETIRLHIPHEIPQATSGVDLAAFLAPTLNACKWEDGGRSLWGDDVVIISGKLLAKSLGLFCKRHKEIPDEALAEYGFHSRNALPAPLDLKRAEYEDFSSAAFDIRTGLTARFGPRPAVILRSAHAMASCGLPLDEEDLTLCDFARTYLTQKDSGEFQENKHLDYSQMRTRRYAIDALCERIFAYGSPVFILRGCNGLTWE